MTSYYGKGYYSTHILSLMSAGPQLFLKSEQSDETISLTCKLGIGAQTYISGIRQVNIYDSASLWRGFYTALVLAHWCINQQ